MTNQAPDTSSMDQVRELLMGAQFKEMEIRVQRQEERFLREITDMRDSLKNRVDSLENFMKSENATIMHRLKEEQTERAAALKNEQRERSESMKQDKRETEEALVKLAKELVLKEETLERKLTALSGMLDTAERELRQLMLAENARLSEKVEEKYKEAITALSNTAQQLRDDLVSRSALSSLFTQVAVTLSGQWSSVSDAREDTHDAKEDANKPQTQKASNKSAGS